jgi:tetratricopeptide (TPR) repeat protein
VNGTWHARKTIHRASFGTPRMFGRAASRRRLRHTAWLRGRLDNAIVMAIAWLALTSPEPLRAQSDKDQPPKRSILGQVAPGHDDKGQPSRRSVLGPSHPIGQEKAGWIGRRVVQKYPVLRLTRADQVFDLRFLHLYVVKEVDKTRLLVQIEGTGDEYWGRTEDVVSLDDSINFFTREIQIRPRDDWGYQMRSACLSAMKETDRALKDINRAILLRPDSGALHSDRGIIWASIKAYDRAIADFDEALRLSPNDFGILALRGDVFADMGQYDNALADSTRSIRLNSLFARAYSTRGRAWAGKKTYEKAIADFDKAIDIDQYLVAAYYYRALTYETTHEYDKAIADYKKIMLLYPHYIAPYVSLAHILTRSDNATPPDVDKAIELMKKACELSDWKDASLIDYLSVQCQKAGREGEAAKWKDRGDDLRAYGRRGARR